MPAPCHIHLDVIQRSRGQTLLHDAAYRMGELVFDLTGKRRDYRASRIHHRGTIVLLPDHADDTLTDPWALLGETAFRERRWDAQEGRKLVIMLPRAVPTELISSVAAYGIAPLIELGMVAQIDVHEPLASDGERHPHVHIWISQRSVEGTSFGRKERAWNAIFVQQAQALRASVSARMTQAMAMLGISEAIDPRSHKAADKPPPLPRLPPHLFRRPERRQLVAELQKLRPTAMEEPEDTSSERWIIPVPTLPAKRSSPACRANPMASKGIASICEALKARGECTFRAQVGFWGIVLEDGSRIVACPQFVRSAGPLTSRKTASVMVGLATAMGWTGVVLEGPDAFATDIVDAALRQRSPVMPINRILPEEAVQDLSRRHRPRFKEAIARMDRTGSLARSIDRYFARPGLEKVASMQNEIEPAVVFQPFPTPRRAAATHARNSEEGLRLWRRYVQRMQDGRLIARGDPPSLENFEDATADQRAPPRDL